jgi:hypothetical protein
MKTFLLILCILVAYIPASAAIRERRAAPLLHSVVDGKGASAYMQPDERPFLPDGSTVYAKPTHGQKVLGYVFTGMGGGVFLFGCYLAIANPAGRGYVPDDVANRPSSLPLAIAMMTIGLAFLVSGMLLLTQQHKGAPKHKKAS